MAHSYSRQIIVYAVPAIAVLLSYFWFKRKRSTKSSDPGDIPIEEELISVPLAKKLIEEPKDFKTVTSPYGSPDCKLPHVLSAPSTPIDIILPRELRSQRTSPIVISDEDLDLEIEKIKSMRSCSAEKHGSRICLTDKIDSSLSEQKIETPKPKRCSPVPTGCNSELFPVKLKTPQKGGQSTDRKKSATSLKMTKVEDKLNNLKMSNKQSQKKVVNGALNAEKQTVDAPMSEEHRQSSERDSANHSPADVMLASPSLSCISDNHSEGSSDSGKGGSDVATPPSRTPAGDSSIPLYYEFTIPQTLVGKLIGRFGAFVTEIKEKTRAHVVIKKHPTANKLKLCVVEGNQNEIDKALKMIRDRFPLKKHPEVTLEQVTISAPISNVPITSDHLYSKLVEGVNNDTIVSCMVTPGHLFLQQPTHPSYPHLQVLSSFMTMCYSNSDSPILPKPIQENTICVAQSVGEWYRAMILSTDEANDTSYVTFLDYGGYAIIPNTQLKQIRGDFLLLPFQAAECFLANVKPAGVEAALWCDEAYNLVAELTKGALALTQIAEYTETGIPLVLMYILVGPQEVVFLNDELVKRGFAEYIQPPLEQQSELQQPQIQPTMFVDDVEGAVGGIVV